MTMGREIRLKLHIDESRIWNIGMRNIKSHSYMIGFMWSDSIVKRALNITGTEKDLSTMTIFQKNVYLRNYSKEVHRTNRDDVFYCNYNKPDTILFHASTQKFLFYRGKTERLFAPKFYHDRNTVNFLKELQFVGEFDAIGKTRFSENPTMFARKLYEYRTKTGETSTKFIETKDNDWPFPDTYFTSSGCSVRGFSFVFPNASTKLKEHLLPSKNLLSITSGTEEVDNVLTQTDFFPIQKYIKDKIDKYNSAPEKNFINESYFLCDKSNLTLDTFITALNKKISIYGSFSYFQGKIEEEQISL